MSNEGIKDGVRLRLIPAADPTARFGARVLTDDGREVADVTLVQYIHKAGEPPRLLIEIVQVNGNYPIIEGDVVAEGRVDRVDQFGDPVGG